QIVKGANGFAAFRPHGVSHDEGGQRTAVLEQVNGGPALIRSTICGFTKCRGDVRSSIPDERWPTHTVFSAVDRGRHALAGYRAKLRRRWNLNRAVQGRLHDGAGDRMFGVALDGGSDAKGFILRQTIGYGHRDHTVLAEGQRTRLVEDNHIEMARLFESAPIANEEAAARTQRRRYRHDERHGQSQRVRASDHEDGDD